MRAPAHVQNTSLTTAKRFVMLLGLLAGAGVLGYGAIVAGDGPDTRVILIGIALLTMLGGYLAVVFGLPVIGAIRIAFIASFFFKGDLSLLKVNEIEDPSGLNLSLTLFTGLILLAYDLVTDESREEIVPREFTALVAGLFVCAAASVVFSGMTALGGFSLISLMTSILIAYVVASHFSRRERMIQLVIGLAVGLLFTGIVSITQFAWDFPMDLANFGTGTEEESIGTQSELLSRVPAFLRTPTEMAWVVTSLIPVVLAPVLCRVKSIGSGGKTLMAAAVIGGISAVILSLARGSWIGLVVSFVMLVLLCWIKLSRYERKDYYLSILGVGVLSAALLVPFSGKIYDRLTDDDHGSAQIRMPLMETALRMIDDNPLVGVGLNGYRTYMTKYDETGMFVSQVFPNPVHNIFAHITAEIGVPGGLIFCLIILFSLYQCYKATATTDRFLYALAIGLGIGLVAFVISGTKEPGSLGSVRPPMRTLFLLIGAIMAVSRIRNRSLRDLQ